MALRKPIVIDPTEAIHLQQVQSDDRVQAGSVYAAIVESLTNANASAAVIGEPVYISAANTVDKARANASGTTKVYGLVYDTSIANAAAGNIITTGVLTATTGQWDAITGQSGGLTTGSEYYLSAATAGRLTTTAPSTVGQFVAPVGIAQSTTSMLIQIKTVVLL